MMTFWGSINFIKISAPNWRSKSGYIFSLNCSRCRNVHDADALGLYNTLRWYMAFTIYFGIYSSCKISECSHFYSACNHISFMGLIFSYGVFDFHSQSNFCGTLEDSCKGYNSFSVLRIFRKIFIQF